MDAKILLLGLIGWLTLSLATAHAQNRRLELAWIPATNLHIAGSGVPADQTGLYWVDNDQLQAGLVSKERNNNERIEISLPMPSGALLRFVVRESPILLPPLDAKHPGIRTFSGWQASEPSTWVKLDITPLGLHAMIHEIGSGYTFIDPVVAKGETYYYTHLTDDVVDFSACGNTLGTPEDANPLSASLLEEIPVLRTYRLALAATAEYTAFHNGKANTLAAQVTTINRINGIYENDLAVHFNIIGNNDTLIYTNPVTDKYTNSNAPVMLSENQQHLDSIIGTANYDIGHVFYCFPTGGSVADVASVCKQHSKARGVSGSPTPMGSAFEINKVAHEIGHQFGANHSFNNSCNTNIDVGSAFETGSGSTIMAYAGICTPNVQPNNDPYFHGGSLLEIKAFLNSPGHTCPLLSPLDNTTPQVLLPAKQYTIPAATPFVLTATGLDPDEDNALTYNWEQTDPAVAPMPPLPNTGFGPAFRSFPPALTPQRYFPDLLQLLGNNVSQWEVLSTVSRVFNFIVTVRDNAYAGGATAVDSVRVNVDADAGPFAVLAPNGAETWTGTNTATVTWDVANTQTGTVHCAAVNILLSTDGGLTFHDTLATHTPNTGSATITVPNSHTDDARILIQCADNIFFDVSDASFAIQPTVAVYNPAVQTDRICIVSNPFRDKLNIEFTDLSSQHVRVTLLNQAGQRILQRQFENSTAPLITLQIPSMPAGMYVAVVETPLFTLCKRIILFP